MAATKTSPSLRAYRSLQKKKAAYCAGKTNKTAVKKAAANYVKSAMKAGKTKADAEKSARRVLNAGCKMSSSVNGKRRKATTRKKRTARK